jgi:hypothetical protein
MESVLILGKVSALEINREIHEPLLEKVVVSENKKLGGKVEENTFSLGLKKEMLFFWCLKCQSWERNLLKT